MNTKSNLLATGILFVSLLAASLSAQTCDENLVFQIDRIKQEVETSLITATNVEVKLVSGETLLAFYNKGSLIKITVDNSANDGYYYIAELFFKDGFIKHIAEEYNKSGKFFKDYYYFDDNKLICYNNENSGDYKSSDKYSKAEKKWHKKINKYLEAIQ